MWEEGRGRKGLRRDKSVARREGMIFSRLTHCSLKLTAQSNSLCELFLGRVDDQMVAKHVQCLVCVCRGEGERVCVCVRGEGGRESGVKSCACV